MNKLFLYIIIFSLYSNKNGIILNKNEIILKKKGINLKDILSHKFIFIHHPWNKISQIIYKSVKEISPKNLIFIDIIHLANPEQFLRNIFKYLNKNYYKDKNINSHLFFPLLIKANNNHLEIYNNNQNEKIIKKFLDEDYKNENKNNKKIFHKINYEFLSQVIFNQNNCLIIFYLKNYKSKQITKKLILKLEQKLDKLNITIAYSDITNKYSYKLFNILEGYENELPCLRYLKFKENKLFFTKKEKINLLDKNIIDSIYNFVNNSINYKLFYHSYNLKIFQKDINHLNNNKYCEKKKNVINLYFKEWCEYCLEILIIIDEILQENKYLLLYFKYNKNNYEKLEYKTNNYNFYFNFLPRLHINDIYKNITYEYLGDNKKEEILNFIVSKINLFINFK